MITPIWLNKRKKDKEKEYPAGYIGLAGELRVMSELLLRNINPAKSYLDHGPDLILESGRKVEIKSSHRGKPYGKAKNGCYTFSLRTGNKNNIKPLNLNVLDFIICWCIDDNVFYIIPTNSIFVRAKSFITITDTSDNSRSFYLRFKNAWNLLTEKSPPSIPEPKQMTQGELYN